MAVNAGLFKETLMAILSQHFEMKPMWHTGTELLLICNTHITLQIPVN